MCYNVAYLTKRKITYARRASASEAEVQDLEEQLEELTRAKVPMFHVSGFAHPQLLCFSRDDGPQFDLLRWGLIPPWARDAAQAAQLSRQTLNARGETIFEKPAFRMAAKHRCLVLVDGFFEFFHFGKRTFPYHIRLRNDEPMALGGIRSTWHAPDTGVAVSTVSIVTTAANVLMERIHNNPKAEGPRMPFIVPRELDALWLNPHSEQDLVLNAIQAYPEAELEAYTVAPLLGKQALGNVPDVLAPISYPELAFS